METAVEFIRRSTVMLNLMIQHGAYPFQLIRDEVLPENLKMHIGRHCLIMDNMTHVSEFIAQSDSKIKICSVFHNMAFKETVLMVEYDETQNNISFVFGYNTEALKTIEAEWIIQRMNDLLWSFMEYENESIYDIIQKNVAFADAFTAENQEQNLGRREASREIECLNMEIVQSKCSIREVFRKDWFKNQTSKGDDQHILMKIVKETCNGAEELLLLWSTDGDVPETELSVNMISEVAVGDIKGHFYIMLKTPQRWYMFETETKRNALDWIENLRGELEILKPLYKHKDEMLYSL